MRSIWIALGFGVFAMPALAANTILPPVVATGCSNPDALGVSRIIEVDTSQTLEVGRIEFKSRLPLQRGEVVLTFDDGPRPGTTDAVLKALQAGCARATFFIVGKMALSHPVTLHEVEASGNTIGTHTFDHPLDLQTRPVEDGIAEIDKGIAAVTEKLGHAPAPFFRFPGFMHTPELLAHLSELHVGVFSADVVGDDWTHITADKVRARVMQRLKEHDGGIIMLHDTKKVTAAMLPALLRDIKAAGYHLVAVVPAVRTPAVAAAATAGVVAAAPPALRQTPVTR